ncbi:hypothetical protein GS907_24415 [Rhodococcus hoagii]|nr:hypothetical protein [Prescottella equi]
MTEAEIVAIGRERGRAQWGNPLPEAAVDLLHQFSRQHQAAEADAA